MRLPSNDPMRKVFASHAFRTDIDRLAADVMDRVTELVGKHEKLLNEAGVLVPEASDMFVSSVVGWLMGFHADDHRSDDDQRLACAKRLAMAAVAAGWSMENVRRVYAKRRH